MSIVRCAGQGVRESLRFGEPRLPVGMDTPAMIWSTVESLVLVVGVPCEVQCTISEMHGREKKDHVLHSSSLSPIHVSFYHSRAFSPFLYLTT